jgi:ATP-dependent Clp protease ATP-binding subunit ClpC
MATRTGNALASLEAQSKSLAQQRKQKLSTAHMLLALYHRGGSATELLVASGVSELALIDGIERAGGDPDLSLALLRERASRLAASSTPACAPTELHALCVITREVRSAAFRVLHALRLSPATLEQAVLHRLRAVGGAPATEPARALQQHASERSPRNGAPRRWAQRRRPTVAAQQQLATETEQRRARMRKQDGGDAVAVPRAAAPRAAGPITLVTEARAAEPQAPLRLTSRAALEARLRRTQTSTLELDAKRFPLLTTLGRNLSVAAADGRIDPVIGRDAEIEQILDVLSRRRGRNPVLVGPAGVGKTSVVEGVAQALVDGGDARIVIELPTGALVSGTGVRGAISERVQTLLREVADAEQRVVLFIDEAHGVLGADEGADSVGACLKTALARGEIACIAATTDVEHRRIFERDAALARRFTRIEVGEPSRDVALAIVRGIAPEYERHHNLRFDDAALEAAVDLSVRFMSERRLPDKAIGLIDQAAARVRRRAGKGPITVGSAAVAESVSEQCGVPLERLLMRDADLLLDLEALLEERVVGQAHVGKAVADALRKGAAGFRGKRPLCTMLFLGPTGVGKTEMAKAIAARMFPGTSLTRIDMSELSESHGVARLLGAPPGYIGHEDGGQLTEAVRQRPYQLILLDEVEKAHRDVLLALLPLLDEGRLTDGRGTTVDFTNTVIVMTSNLGVEALSERRAMGFDASSELERATHGQARRATLLQAARRALPPELWNRIDEPLCFDALAQPELARIARMLVAHAAQLAQREHGITLAVDDSAFEVLVRNGFDPALGARPMRRAISRLLEAPIARAVLSGSIKRGETLSVYAEGEQLAVRVLEREVDAAE